MSSHPDHRHRRLLDSDGMDVCPHLMGLTVEVLLATEAVLVPSVDAASCSSCWEVLQSLVRTRHQADRDDPLHEWWCDLSGDQVPRAQATLHWVCLGSAAHAQLILCGSCLQRLQRSAS